MPKNGKHATCNTSLANQQQVVLKLLSRNNKKLLIQVTPGFRQLVRKSGKGYGTKRIQQMCCSEAEKWAHELLNERDNTLKGNPQGKNRIEIILGAG